MRPAALAAATAAGLLVPAAAHAATLELDRTCYPEQTRMVATGTGFTPGSPVTIGGAAQPVTVTAGGDGSFEVPLQVPLNPSDSARREARTTGRITAQDGGASASRRFRITNFAFRTTAGVRSASARRRWTFTGFDVGRSIYVHFRHHGRTAVTYRMGVAKGPCGALTRRAPLIPVDGPVSRGTWRIQADNRRAYRRSTRPRITTKVTVFSTFRPRAAAS